MKRFGPGLLVTAAFIGPGTVTTASAAGANYGFALLWALLFSVLAILVLQEMAARLGLVRGGLAQALRDNFESPWLRDAVIVLIVAAVGVGNAAYEAGNIAGASLGLSQLSGSADVPWALIIGGAAGLMLWSSAYRRIEGILVVLVLLMSVVFISTFAVTAPALGDLLAGLKPAVPEGGLLTVIALIGTTVVPYNLFLHASAVRDKWSGDMPLEQQIHLARQDSFVAIGLGGLITMAIMSTAAVAFFSSQQAFTAQSMAAQLQPLLGDWAGVFFAIGLFAAGMTSAITAPLAAAYAVCGAMAWPVDFSDRRFRAVWLTILVIGTGFATVGSSPIQAILFAQAANGFLLPVVAIFLLVVMNNRNMLGDYRNRLLSNVIGTAVVAVVSALGIYKLAGALLSAFSA